MTGVCAKQVVTATVVAVTGRRFIGINYVNNPQGACPRADMPTGVDYELCRSVCDQPAHAEINALKAAGAEAHGATLYLEGHTYACRTCQVAAYAAGVIDIVIGVPP